MKPTKYLLVFLVSVAILARPAFALELPERLNQIGDVYTPRVLPDSPWYFIKNIRDQLKIVLTFDPSRKAFYQIELANKKTLELQQLCEIGKCRYSKSMAPTAIKFMSLAASLINSEKRSGKDIADLIGKYKDNSIRQLFVLSRLSKIAPPEDKDLIIKNKGELMQVAEGFVKDLEGENAVKDYTNEVFDTLNEGNSGI